VSDRPDPVPRSNVQKQIEFYERTARGFDRSIWSLGNRDNRNHHAKITAIARALDIDAVGSLLEVGTGTGLHALRLMEGSRVRYVGLDVSSAMLETARGRLHGFRDRVQLAVADGSRVPFPDGTFDAAFCAGTLHHMADPSRGLRELVRVVRPGGRVAAMEPNWKFPSVLAYTAMTRAEWNTFKISPARLEAWARASGLDEVRVRRLLYTPPRPRSWGKTWDAIDAGVARTPVLRRLSIVLLVSGRVRLRGSAQVSS